MNSDSTGISARLPLCERARQGLLQSEPLLSLDDVAALEHPADDTARQALRGAIQAAIDYGDLPACYVESAIDYRLAGGLSKQFDDPLLDLMRPTYHRVGTSEPIPHKDPAVDRDAYRAWRAQCPASLLSPLSQVSKWLGDGLPAEPSLPESEPVTHGGAARPESAVRLTESQQDRIDCQAIARKLWLENPDWIQADLLRHREILRYVNKWKGKHTVPGWLSEVNPHPKEQRRGRPKKYPV